MCVNYVRGFKCWLKLGNAMGRSQISWFESFLHLMLHWNCPQLSCLAACYGYKLCYWCSWLLVTRESNSNWSSAKRCIQSNRITAVSGILWLPVEPTPTPPDDARNCHSTNGDAAQGNFIGNGNHHSRLNQHFPYWPPAEATFILIGHQPGEPSQLIYMTWLASKRNVSKFELDASHLLKHIRVVSIFEGAREYLEINWLPGPGSAI